MARTVVPREALYRADLPPICVVTGRPADGTVRARFDSLPSWTWILLLFGVFPFLIASLFATERVVGEVPVVREAVERFHSRRRWGAVTLVAGVAGLMYAAWAPAGWMLWPSVPLTMVGVAACVRASFSLADGRPLRDGTHVQLSRVHPDFVAAVEEQARRSSASTSAT